MRLTSLSATGYRSLRSIRLDIGQLALFVGENGVGKSNLYRAIQLIRASAEGTLPTSSHARAACNRRCGPGNAGLARCA